MTPHLTPLEHRTEPLLRRLVGSILREQRERQRRTLRDVAEDARVSVAYLSEVERGRKEPSSEVLAAVCRALGLRLVDLVGTAHAQLALAEGRLVVDLTAPDRHELATVTTLTAHADAPAPAGEVGTAVLLAA
ncbi:hypothetical protein CXY01_37270 [Cellulomonas xylanilytica]|uniref:HTH cro/C1-type domain-containing protein n=2 Tax=Cellulomonas xylanilytica TaxID=233583 RepID=A0A510V8L4_9CELL|nr:hypothetical protein CXY01_37270 [Cellulomonas xylanilytica]